MCRSGDSELLNNYSGGGVDEKETFDIVYGSSDSGSYRVHVGALYDSRDDGMSEVIYRKVMKGKKTTYEIVPVIEGATLNLTEPECLTAAGALGVTLLMIFERNLPKMKNGTPKLAERKIAAVTAAILDLYKGTGEAINDDIALLIFEAWDKTMKSLSQEETQ